MRIDSGESYLDVTRDADGNVIALVTCWQGIAHGPQTLRYPNVRRRLALTASPGREPEDPPRVAPPGNHREINTLGTSVNGSKPPTRPHVHGQPDKISAL
ncbi:hypothetical protein AB0A63_31880 [Lentzea sp. NPDC042327]|uniref:hypothetical protein n=1 Tax=Lentzea sp. NPDC042327 TaxID=3154801 RepID=UPI0033E1DD55